MQAGQELVAGSAGSHKPVLLNPKKFHRTAARAGSWCRTRWSGHRRRAPRQVQTATAAAPSSCTRHAWLAVTPRTLVSTTCAMSETSCFHLLCPCRPRRVPVHRGSRAVLLCGGGRRDAHVQKPRTLLSAVPWRACRGALAGRLGASPRPSTRGVPSGRWTRGRRLRDAGRSVVREPLSGPVLSAGGAGWTQGRRLVGG